VQERQLMKITDPVQFGHAVNRMHPDAQLIEVDVLANDACFGYVLDSQGNLKVFRACFGDSGVWTLSPVYTR
jgi:hypothetical protein